MDRMYAPWRLAFLKGQVQDDIPSPTNCIFCDYPLAFHADPLAFELPAEGRRAWDKRRLVVTAREHAFVILNKYPYTNGHVMVVPRQHTDRLEQLDEAAFHGLQALLRETVAALRAVYTPNGMNVGMNMGEAAGAGIAEHLHWHALPRWRGDVNFMPAIGDTKVISESLDDTWTRLAALLRTAADD
ncbi:MAG TPA: HIT domain-containing protein [Myxococcota bacterium]|jgi:ATP adenylyltransferase